MARLEAKATVLIGEVPDGHAGLDRQPKALHIVFQIGNEFVLGQGPPWVWPFIRISRQHGTEMGRIEAERVPALRPPRFADAAAIDHAVIAPQRVEMVAHGQPCRTRTDDNGVQQAFRISSHGQVSCLVERSNYPAQPKPLQQMTEVLAGGLSEIEVGDKSSRFDHVEILIEGTRMASLCERSTCRLPRPRTWPFHPMARSSTHCLSTIRRMLLILGKVYEVPLD